MRYGNISEQFGVTGKINISVKEDSETIMESLLHAEELALIPPTWSEKRKKTFVMGRLAAKQAMERLGIYEYRTHHPNTLSGGQKQRAAVAVSMVCRKDVLIFDEPTSGLDYDSMIQVAGLFQTLSKMGKVIFVVTHDYEFLAAACTRVIHLDNGKQQEDYLLSPDNLHRLRDFFLRSERRQNLEENGK